MNVVQGGCFCRAVRYRVSGPPRRVTHCYCTHCRGTTGAPVVTWAECARGQVAFAGAPPGTIETRPGVTRWFCTACGTQLAYLNVADPQTIDLTAGSFDQPETLRPDDHVWCRSKVPWIDLSDALPRHALGRGG